MTTRYADHVIGGDHASRPVATAVPEGTTYSCTDHDLEYQSDGATWSTRSTFGVSGAYSPGGTDVAVADGGTGASTASAARTNLGVVIGSDVQAFDADIPTVAASQAEMEAGTEAALRSMSPLRVAQAIAALESGGSGNVATDAIWDAAGDLAVGSGANTAAKLAVGSEDDVLTVVSGVPAWAAPTGGGGVTHAYAGTNAIGGSTEAITNRRQYMQKVTLANDCMIESVGAYVRQVNAGNVMGFGVGVLSDNSNAPKNVLAFNMGPSPSSYLSTAIGVQGDARWFHMAVGLWAPAGDYWLAVSIVVAGADSYQLYYDAGGDRYHDNAAWWISDAASGHADSTRKYSIRASTIR